MIIVFGSLNTDICFDVSHFPQPGETVSGESYHMAYGGKGANQALAAARMGPKTALVGCVGDDGMGVRIRNGMKREGVMVSGVAESETHPTGLAMITRDENGENNIMAASGANLDAREDQVPDNVLQAGNILLMQMEVPAEEVFKLAERAHKDGARVMLNLAPMRKIREDQLDHIDDLLLNEIEARQLASHLNLKNTEAPEDIAKEIAKTRGLTCIITCGANGVHAVTKDGEHHHMKPPAIDKIVDTTGAGDVFCGTYAACIHNGKSFINALRHAVAAGTLACTKMGAQDSIPYSGDISDYIELVEIVS